MRVGALFAAMICAAAPSLAAAQSGKVLQGPEPKWTLPPPDAASAIPAKDALLQVHYLDRQVRITAKGQETYTAQRYTILRPDALSAANLRFVWKPSNGQLTVHSIRLYRKDGSVAEMLGKADFQIIQREESLEQSILTGLATAVFAIPGVETGDDIAFSATISDRDPTLGDKVFGLMQLPIIDIGGVFRTRLLQENGRGLTWRATPDLAGSLANGPTELLVKLENPKSANLPQGAPGRYATGRLVEWSSFSDWPQISATFWKHFDQASTIPKDSPLKAEIARISAESEDAKSRVRAALKFVQERIRYVYVGLGAGNLTPASVETTWERRYGDCKGKAALLMALLKELGIQAEAVLVNQSGMDGIEGRLPSPGLFDHVLVRATINDKAYWLDGTQLVGPELSNIPPPTFRTALPLRRLGAGLEVIPPAPLSSPMLVQILDIDATAGSDKPAHIKSRQILHGQDVAQFRVGLSSLAGDDLNRAIRNIIQYSEGARDGETTGWSYDEATGSLNMMWQATQKLDWVVDEDGSSWFYIPGAGFIPPEKMERPKEQDQTAPWGVDQPYFKCWITNIRLPPEKGRVRWTYSSKRVNHVLGGVEYYRQATLKSGVVQTVMSRRAVLTELSPAEAKAFNASLDSFDSEKSYIFQTTVGRDAGNTDDPREILDISNLDWASSGAACRAPNTK